MNEGRADFAVFGSTPLARLVAGLLARDHGKRVVLVSDGHWGLQLPRAIELSVGAITRPETWALLAATVPETTKLLIRIGGKAAMSRINSILFAESPLGRQGLAYIRNTAAGFGHGIERLAPMALGPDRDGVVIRDAMHLRSGQIEPVLDKWLDRIGVIRRDIADVAAVMLDDGRARISGDDDIIEADTPVLADDAAILAHLPERHIARLFEHRTHATILTEPALPLAAPVMIQIDEGVCLAQRASRGIIATGPGDLEALTPRLNVLLSADRHLRRAGQSIHGVLLSVDRAPIIGRIEEQSPVLLANLAPIGAFLAPAIARFLVGNGRDDESAYFASHAPTRSLAASLVGEYRPDLFPSGAAA